jgi:hypothetical protein
VPQKVVVLLICDVFVNCGLADARQKVIDLIQRVVDSFFGLDDVFGGDDDLTQGVGVSSRGDEASDPKSRPTSPDDITTPLKGSATGSVGFTVLNLSYSGLFDRGRRPFE